MYFSDHFRKPWPFTPDLAVDITEVVDKKVAMYASHESQVFEWLPWTYGTLSQVPSDPVERMRAFTERQHLAFQQEAYACRALLVSTYGAKGHEIKFAESFELCEYGAPLTDAAKQRLFPFLPSHAV